jgi:ArsR family transcriptional regulator, zinc-responsive transcriptional repressor
MIKHMTISLDADILEKMADILKSIAHPVRLKIIEVLKDHDALSVSEIMEKVEVEQSLLSHHLIKLKDKQILNAKRTGKNIHYSLHEKKITDIFECIGYCKFLK